MTDADLPITTPRRAPARRPLSSLRPSPCVARAAEKCASLLHHPRSRIRISPAWQAPSLRVRLPAGSATVFVSQRRASELLWRRLTGAAVTDVSPESPPLLVTLTAVVEPGQLRGSLRDMTTDVHSLFRNALTRNGTAAEHISWTSIESCGESPGGQRRREWTWHVLLCEPGYRRDPLPQPGHRAA